LISSRQRRPTITIIGAGRLGTALGVALCSRGYTIEALVARRLSHARRAARLIQQTETRAFKATQLRELPASRILLITTPDDAIQDVAEKLTAHAAKSLPVRGSRRVALHASGALSSEVLESLQDARFQTGSMHPLVSVSDALTGAENFRGAFFCVEGQSAAVRVARSLVSDLEGHAFSINTKDKALYHAAAVMASGHVVALLDIALEMLTRCGLSERRARATLMPLVRSTVENLSTQEPARALTGTFARADAATVKRHLDALRSQNLTDALAVYRLLGERSLRLLEVKLKGKALSSALEEIKGALAKAVKTRKRK
jgi:predicted short-subunit dehydrogenase-like oxidoreductase (DUF2520 family)